MDYAFMSERDRSAHRQTLIKRMQTMSNMRPKSSSKEQRKSLTRSITAPSPAADLIHRGIIKISFDRGYATQTKSILVEGKTTAAEVVDQLFDQLNLTGNPQEFCIEERNHMSGETRYLNRFETPLANQHRHGAEERFVELWLVQTRDHSSSRGSGGTMKSRLSSELDDSDSDLDDGETNVSPKEEVSDHGLAKLEGVLEEALQDLPSLIHEIQERLRVLSTSVADEDGKPKPGLPPRRMLWDQLKPQAAQLVREIRRLVDSCEFLANRHCPSSVCQKIVSLLVELITDHSRELVSVTKEMCALRGAAQTEFDSSVTAFANQIEYISNLIGKSHNAIRAAAISGHLLQSTDIHHIEGERMQVSGGVCFTGSKHVAGVLIFAEVSALLGLVRAGYDDKREYFAKLAANLLRTANWAMNTVRETTEYSLLHLHPLRSRVHDMEQKLKVSMDSLVIAVRKAASYKSPPVSVPEMLLAAHDVVMSSLDYLVVAQCASLLHQVFIPREDVLQMPWVQGALASKGNTTTNGCDSKVSLHSSKSPSINNQSLSSITTSTTDTASSTTTSDAASSRHSPSGKKNRRSRLVYPSTESRQNSVPMIDDNELSVSFSKLGMGASRLQLTGEMIGKEDTAAVLGTSSYDEVSQYLASGHTSPTDVWSSSSGRKKKRPKKQKARPKLERDSSRKESSDGGDLEVRTEASPPKTSVAESQSEDSEGGGSIEAIQRIRRIYNINKAIARVAEALLLTVARKITMLNALMNEGNKERCGQEVELVVSAAKQIREEISVMDVDLLVASNVTDTLQQFRPQLEAAIRDVTFASKVSFSPNAPDGLSAKVVSTLKVLQEMCSKMISEALKIANEHKKALDKAEEIEKEFIGLMTGHTHINTRHSLTGSKESEMNNSGVNGGRKMQSKYMATDSEAEKVIFEDRAIEGFLPATKSWSTRTAPLVIGGTLKQLIDRLTYPRSVDVEFAEVFLHTFHSFITPLDLLDALILRFKIRLPEGLSQAEEENMESEAVIPTRLRVVSVLRNWLYMSYDDFRSREMQQKLRGLCEFMESTMPACSKQLQGLLKENLEDGPIQVRQKPQQQAPPPIVPQGLTPGGDFKLQEVNTLELARQLTLICSQKFRDIRCHDLIPRHVQTDTAIYIREMLDFSKKVSHWVIDSVSSQDSKDSQASLISYFIQMAKNCHDLKNFEGFCSIMRGLRIKHQESSPIWQLVSSHITSVYYSLLEVISKDNDYARYRQELRMVSRVPCVPSLSILMDDITRVDKEFPDVIPGLQDVINFQKHRCFARIFYEIIRFQSTAYALLPVKPMQAYFSMLSGPSTSNPEDNSTY